MKTLLLILFLVGCSSHSGRKSSSTSAGPEVNFANAKKAPYRENLDSHLSPQSAVPYQLGLDESLQGQEESDDVLKEGDGITQALAQCYAQKIEEGLNALDKIYDLFQEHPSWWNSLGVCSILKGEGRKAVLYFNKALELKKDYPPAYNNLGVYFLQRGEEQKALEAFNRAISAGRSLKVPLVNRALLYTRYGLGDKAYADVTGLMKRYGESDILLLLQGSILYQVGKFEDAVRIFEKVPDKSREKNPMGVNFALSLLALNKKEDAKKEFSSIDENIFKDKKVWERYSQLFSY